MNGACDSIAVIATRAELIARPMEKIMKPCVLILAHHEPLMLGRLVHRIERAGIAAYVHIDARLVKVHVKPIL